MLKQAISEHGGMAQGHTSKRSVFFRHGSVALAHAAQTLRVAAEASSEPRRPERPDVVSAALGVPGVGVLNAPNSLRICCCDLPSVVSVPDASACSSAWRYSPAS